MTQRAAIRQADLNRFAKVAKANGLRVVWDGAAIQLLPIEAEAPVSSAPTQSDDDWDKALGLK